jgi:SAM-dependent methyltransferase
VTAAERERLERLLGNEFDMGFRRRALWLVDALDLAPELDVLDLGCGPGWYLHALSQVADVRLTAIDRDPERVAAAAALGVADVHLGDAQRLPFPDARFDRVLFTEVLEHLPDDAAALAEVARVLRPGGVLALTVPHADFPKLWDPVNPVWIALGGQPIRRGPVAGIWSNHERLYRPADVAERISAAGLEVERVAELTHYAFPFTALLVYGFGKPLLEHGLLPERLRRTADRFSAEENTAGALGPLNLARRPFVWVDRLNERAGVRTKRTWMNVAVKARKPDGS